MKRLHKNACVLVVDGARALIYRNMAAPPDIHLTLERQASQADPATHELGASRPGKLASSSGVRSAVEQPDYHQMAEDAFVKTIAQQMKHALDEGQFEELVVIAPPVALAVLRRSLALDVKRAIILELNKDLTKHQPVAVADEIRRALEAANS